eukprot:scaffold1456_cov392-Prasinococcus_capsulatus_cf.AAC.8
MIAGRAAGACVDLGLARDGTGWGLHHTSCSGGACGRPPREDALVAASLPPHFLTREWQGHDLPSSRVGS